MKITVLGANQRKAVEMKLDLKDLVILEWMQKFWPRMKKKIIDGKEYGWVNYGSLLKDYPLLEIKGKKTLYRRMKAMEDLGILDHRGVKDATGSFSYYRLTEKVLELIDDEASDGGRTFESHGSEEGGTEKSHGRTQESQGGSQKSQPVGLKSPNKDPSSNNLLIKSFLSLPLEEKKEFLKKIFLEKRLKSSPEKYLLFRERQNWKGVSNLDADIAWWENGFKEKNPDLYEEKQFARNANYLEEPEEIKNLRSEIKGLICRDNENGYIDHRDLFSGKSIEKTSKGYVIKVSDDRALKYQDILNKINVKIEI